MPLAFGLAALLPSAPAAQTAGPNTVQVIVINFDPVLKTRNNLRLHEYMKWSDPWKLTDKLVEDARVASGGWVDYRIAQKMRSRRARQQAQPAVARPTTQIVIVRAPATRFGHLRKRMQSVKKAVPRSTKQPLK